MRSVRAICAKFWLPQCLFSPYKNVRPPPPPTGQNRVTASNCKIEDWAKQQPDKPSRSEAIRRLVQLALAGKGKEP
jgi:hypothetical protein